MGLLSAFGFGGGKLDAQLEGKQFTAGGALHGRVIFKAGKRQQEIKNITANVSVTTYKTEPGPNGPQRNSQTDTFVKNQQITGPFVSQPGNTYEYELAIPLPEDLYNSDPDVSYRLKVSADIDGELDPGDGEAFTVVGGRPFPKPVIEPAPQAAAQPAAVPASMPVPALAVGDDVLAQFSDGSWQQAKVIAFSGTMAAVDWVDPRLGASTWVQSQQVMPAAPPPAPPVAPPLVPGQPYAVPPGMGQPYAVPPGMGQPYAVPPGMGQPREGQPFPGQPLPGQPTVPAQLFPGQPMPAQAPVPGQAFSGQPVAGQPIPGQPFPGQPLPGQPILAMPVVQQPLGVGAPVLAQWTDGNWYPGTVVQMQGSMVGVDWEDPRLGASSWVQGHQAQLRT
jgi:hypothetical protein